MRVLMIAPQPFLEPRGTPISVYQRIQGLSALGHTVDLVTYHIGSDVQIEGVDVHRILNVPFIKTVKVGPSSAKILLDALLFWKAVQLILLRPYDVIHSHEEGAFIALVLSFLFGIPHLYDMHSSLPQQLVNFNFGNYRPIIKVFEVLERWTIRTCTAVITVGSDLEQYVKEINPTVKHAMIENLPVQSNGYKENGMTSDEVKRKLNLHGRVPVVYTGTFERYQGIDLLIESATLVRKQYPDVTFVLVGGKPEQVAECQHLVRKHNLEDCVLFTGIVPVEEVNPYLEMADVLVSPRTEGLSVPLKIYSYLHSGKPIVATDIVAHTLVLNGDTAVLVPPTKEAFAEGLSQVIRDTNLRSRLGDQAKQLAEEEYSFNSYLAKLDRIYRLLEPSAHTSETPAQMLTPGETQSLEN